jgi:hypothetical protein
MRLDFCVPPCVTRPRGERVRLYRGESGARCAVTMRVALSAAAVAEALIGLRRVLQTEVATSRVSLGGANKSLLCVTTGLLPQQTAERERCHFLADEEVVDYFDVDERQNSFQVSGDFNICG